MLWLPGRFCSSEIFLELATAEYIFGIRETSKFQNCPACLATLCGRFIVCFLCKAI